MTILTYFKTFVNRKEKMIIYKNNNTHHPLLVPIRQTIEEAKVAFEKEMNITKFLFNVETEGLRGDEIFDEKAYERFCENISFMKEFNIPKKWLEPTVSSDIVATRQRVLNFVRGWLLTQEFICSLALINGEKTEMKYKEEKIDISLPGGEPLFSGSHKWGSSEGEHGVQSNYFYEIFGEEKELSDTIKKVCEKLKKMKDETGKPLGYKSDIIIIPVNHEELRRKLLKVLSRPEFEYFTLVTFPGWTTNEPRMMVMSSKANKELSGNVFFNRVPLVVSNWVDEYTGNYIWNGRCRFGVGFGSYKHIALVIDSEDDIPGTTKI
jgi:hypothetical protein